MAQTNETFDNINKSVKDAPASFPIKTIKTTNIPNFNFDLSNNSDPQGDIFLKVVTTQSEPLYSRGCTKIYIDREAVSRVLDSTRGREWCVISARGGGAVTWYIFRNNKDMYFIHKSQSSGNKYSYSRTSRAYVHELINAY
jgi:hypothetical protein